MRTIRIPKKRKRSDDEFGYHAFVKQVTLWECLLVCEEFYRKNDFIIVDPYCGSGEVKCTLTHDLQITGDGSPLVISNFCKVLGKTCRRQIFSDLDEEVIIDLKNNITDSKLTEKTIFLRGNVNKIIDEIIEYSNQGYRKFFFLDPFNSRDLKWTTIKKIGNCCEKVQENKIKFTKRPELLINLMTHSMSRMCTTEGGKKYISECLGTNKWMKSLDDYLKDKKTYLLFRDIFEQQLGKLYRDSCFVDDLQPKPQYFQINNPHVGSPLYYLFFISSHFELNKKIEALKPEIEKKANTLLAKLYLAEKGYKNIWNLECVDSVR